jgi:AraC-like DNA-binding protein
MAKMLETKIVPEIEAIIAGKSPTRTEVQAWEYRCASEAVRKLRTRARTRGALINDRLLTEAKRNLLYSGMTVNEIGASLGYVDPAYFNRFFSRNVGLSPGRFRDSLLPQENTRASMPSAVPSPLHPRNRTKV